LPVFTSGDPDIAAEQVMHHLPGPILLPWAEVVIDHAPRRQVMGQHAPGAAAAQEREDGVQDLTLRVGFRSAAWFGFWNQMLDQVPFVITESGRV
jgi:hypothetical protein